TEGARFVAALHARPPDNLRVVVDRVENLTTTAVLYLFLSPVNDLFHLRRCRARLYCTAPVGLYSLQKPVSLVVHQLDIEATIAAANDEIRNPVKDLPGLDIIKLAKVDVDI